MTEYQPRVEATVFENEDVLDLQKSNLPWIQEAIDAAHSAAREGIERPKLRVLTPAELGAQSISDVGTHVMQLRRYEEQANRKAA